ncbi:MAG: NPCBM/NEW2 domain-containing protein [Abditibacteriota bacterium]|nr:NPCBM/NEW2 domain-containing protein [Abditibacteriota bacterium]
MKYYLSIILILLTVSSFAQKVIFTDDFEKGTLESCWSVSENCDQKLENENVFKPFKAPSFSLWAKPKERCVFSQILKDDALKNILLSDSFIISFAYYTTGSDYVSCEIITDKGVYQKTISPVRINTWNEVFLKAKDFQSLSNQGELKGKILTEGITFSSCGEGEFIIDNISISTEKSINIITDSNFIPIYGKRGKVTAKIFDETGKPYEGKVLFSCDGGTFKENSVISKDGVAETVFIPEKVGLYNINVTAESDTTQKPIVIVEGVKNIDWTFPTNSKEQSKSYEITIPSETVALAFKGEVTEELFSLGNPFYLYVDGKQVTGSASKFMDIYSQTYNLEGKEHYFLLLFKDITRPTQVFAGIKNIREIILSKTPIENQPKDFLTNLKGIKTEGKEVDPISDNDIEVISVLCDNYFVKKGEEFKISASVKNNGQKVLRNVVISLFDENLKLIGEKTEETFEPNATYLIDFPLTHNDLGYKSYYIVANKDNRIFENTLENNSLPLLQKIYVYEEKSPTLKIENLKATAYSNKINVSATTNEIGDAFITLKKDKALYFVHNFKAEKNINESFIIPDIPTGDYEVEFGVYEKAPIEKVSVNLNIKTENKKPIKPMSYGTFVDMEKVPHFWYVNHSNTLLWEGKPYMPFGYMFVGSNFVPAKEKSTKPLTTYEGTLEEILVMQGVNSLGITEMENTSKIEAFMEEIGMTYSTHGGVGNVVYWQKYPMQAYLVKNGKHFIDLTSSKCEYDFTDLRGEKVKNIYTFIYDLTENKPIGVYLTENSSKVDISLPDYNSEHRYRAFFTAELIGGHALHDYWSAWDDRIKQAKEILDKKRFPSSVRYAIDPMENEEGFFFNNDPYKIPSVQAYIKDIEALLKDKYENIENITKAWAVLSGDLRDFNTCASLVPCQVIDDKAYVYNISSKEIITLDAKKSVYWYDIIESRDTSLRNLHTKYCNWFKEYCDVPIVSKRVGGHTRAFTCDREYGSFDGVAVDCYNLSTSINKTTGAFVADIEDSAKTGWFPTLEINYETPSPTKPTEGWPNEGVMREDFARFLEMGVKGFNIFALDLRNTATDVYAWPKFDVMLHPYQLEWYNSIKTSILEKQDSLINMKPKVAYIYPTLEPELNSFVYKDKSHSGLGWSSVKSKSGYWFIPTYNFNHDNLTVTSLPESPADMFYGKALNDAIKENVSPILYIGLRNNIGVIPELDKLFKDSFKNINTSFGDIKCQELNVPNGFTVTHKEGKFVYGITNGILSVVAMDVDPTLYVEKEEIPVTLYNLPNTYSLLGVKDSTVADEIDESLYVLGEESPYIYLSELTPTYAKQGFGVLEIDHNLDMGPLSCKGVKFKHGLASHAPAEIIYDLEGKYSKFATFIGLCDVYVDLGTVTYDIYVDGKNVFSSGLVRGSDLPRKVEIDVKGAKELKFIIGDGGDSNHADHASFFEARLYK